MTLTNAALTVLSASQSESLESVESSLRQLGDLVRAGGAGSAENLGNAASEIAAAMSILRDVRTSLHAHRARLVESLQQLENSSLYSHPSPALSASWEIAG